MADSKLGLRGRFFSVNIKPILGGRAALKRAGSGTKDEDAGGKSTRVELESQKMVTPRTRKSCIRSNSITSTLLSLDLSVSLHSGVSQEREEAVECKERPVIVSDKPGMGFVGNDLSIVRKAVSFHNVEVREYPRTLGDHPDTDAGPPITLSWEFLQLPVQSLSHYECERGPMQSDFSLEPDQRRQLLRDAVGYGAGGGGFTEEELKEAERKVARAVLRRLTTKALLPLSRLEEAVQSIMRKIKRRSWKSGGGLQHWQEKQQKQSQMQGADSMFACD